MYRPAGMRLARALVRTKVLQLAGVGALAPLALGFGSLSALEVYACGGVALGSAAATACLVYFQSRYVGELATHVRAPVARFSVLDFWGSRQEVLALEDKVEPPFRNASKEQLKESLASPGLVRVRVAEDEGGEQREFIIVPALRRHWDAEEMHRLLTGAAVER